MGKSSLEKIYTSIDASLNKNLNSDAPFSLAFSTALETGKNEINQKQTEETKVFDTSWIDAIDEALPHIEKIILNPRKFIKEIDEIVPVELAKKTNKDSVRHLAQHTQFIRSIEDENVTPNKILTTYKDENLAIYENRFIKTLIDKLNIFVERRYEALIQNQESFIKNDLKLKSDFNYLSSFINVELIVNLKEDLKDSELGKKNKAIIERAFKVKDYVRKLKGSRFMQELEGAKKVTPPIMKTNIIMKQPDYRAAYKLWTQIESYSVLGYDIDIKEKDLPIDDEYLDDIYHLIELSALTLIYNQQTRTTDYDEIPANNKKLKRPKNGQWYSDQIDFVNGEIKLEDNEINEYYYQKSKNNVRTKLSTLVRSGYSYEDAFRNVIKQMMNINNVIINNGLLNADFNHVLDEEEDNLDDNKFMDIDVDINKETLEKKLEILERQTKLLLIAEELKRNDLETLDRQLENLNKQKFAINCELSNRELNDQIANEILLEESFQNERIRRIKPRERDITKHLELLKKVQDAGLARQKRLEAEKLHEKERFEKLKLLEQQKKAEQKEKNKEKKAHLKEKNKNKGKK